MNLTLRKQTSSYVLFNNSTAFIRLATSQISQTYIKNLYLFRKCPVNDNKHQSMKIQELNHLKNAMELKSELLQIPG